MQNYVNKGTLVENEISKIFEVSSMCPLCNNILINPLICLSCQNNYCKRCIDEWKEKNEKCPKGCESPNYQKSIGKNDILSKLNFKCVGCGKEIPYDQAESHHNSCCPDKTSLNMDKPVKEAKQISKVTPKESKMKKISPEESAKLVKKGQEMVYITGK